VVIVWREHNKSGGREKQVGYWFAVGSKIIEAIYVNPNIVLVLNNGRP
jgi:hypothetical protein